jgi:DivIVA domain-containing protein
LPLDRQSIEKRDFPIGRRGYEPEAVDAFLAGLADEIDALQRGQKRRTTESLAQAASEQVRAIVEAAESTAAEIERTAVDEAAEIRSDAKQDAERTRNDAIDRARQQVGQVTESTSSMLERVDAMENELTALLEALRTGANRLNADLALLEGNLGDLYRVSGAGEPAATGLPAEDAGPEPVAAQAAASPPVTPEVESFEDPDVAGESAAAAAQATPPAPAVPPPPAVEPEPAAEEPEPAAPSRQRGGGSRAGNGDVEGARLIALNMALNGQSREETDRYLADNFDLANREELLDEVYSSVEG